MHSRIRTCLVVSLFLFSSMSLQGCDQIKKLFDYFSPQKKATPQSVQPVSTPPPAGTDQIREVSPVDTASRTAPRGPDTLAQVGDWSITQEEFNERLKALKEVLPPEYDVSDTQNKKFVLEELIRQELMVQEARRRGLDKDPDVMMAIDEFQRTLLVRQLADQIVADTQPATAEEARQYYEENQADLTEWKLREVVLDSQQAAKDVLVEILQGADFSETAKAKSKGPTAAQGGDLGYVVEFDFPQLRQAVVTMEVGDTSSVISGPDGFYIVKLEDKRVQPFEAIQEEIVAGLTLLKQQQAVMDVLGKLEQKTQVYKNERLLEE